VLIPWNIRDFCTIDRQMEDEICSKVRCSLHNQATAFAAIARLGLAAADEDCASESKNQKDPAGGVMSQVHNST